MLNFLYCFDENYNLQAFTSINSLLENINSKINIYIIHKSPSSFSKYQQILIKSKFVNKLIIYQFDKKAVNFPNLKEAHVSEATYYRLYISEHIPKSVSELVYLDPDVLCLQSPEKELKERLKKLKDSEQIVSAHTEIVNNNSNIRFDDLQMKNKNYFNAGVMLIDYQKWIDRNVSETLINTLESIKNEIELWDQDVMNSYFDGRYLELEKEFNYLNAYIQNLDENDLMTIYFVHFSGKYKPWTVKGVNIKLGNIYHDYFFKSTGKKYHIDNNWKVQALRDVIRILFSGDIFKLQYPLSYLKYCFFYFIT